MARPGTRALTGGWKRHGQHGVIPPGLIRSAIQARVARRQYVLYVIFWSIYAHLVFWLGKGNRGHLP
jgi:hypothetical protein